MNASVKPLPDQLHVDDADGTLVSRDYLATITDAITNHPRSLQKAIGPSEIGDPCDRRIGYKLLQHPERPQQPNWLATIGTGVHSWLEEQFDQASYRMVVGGADEERWLTETRVTVGYVPGLGFIEGSCDLYDRHTATVIDHKIVGPTALKKYKAAGPGDQYRTQAHLYGQGWAARGHRVERVMIAFLPRNAPLDGAYLWSEPFDPQIAQQGLQRLARIHGAIAAVGPAVLAALPIADAHCGHCPFLAIGSTDPTRGCPGHPAAGLATQSPALSLAG